MAMVTSGPFPVEFAGNGARVYLFVSSFYHSPQVVAYTVNELLPDGSTDLIHRGDLPVPPFEAASVIFDDVDDKVVEVYLNIPNTALQPTLSLIGTFLADGAQRTLLWIPPRGFSPLPSDGPPATGRRGSSRRRTLRRRR